MRALTLSALLTLPASADPASTAPSPPTASPPPTPAVFSPPSTGDLQSPEQVSVRNSAYSVPQGTWAFELGALGIGSGDVYARAGVTYGIGAGLQVSMNIAHSIVGLFNVVAKWHFIDTRYFDLGARVGALYGYGPWVWATQGLNKELLSKLAVVNLPVALTASTLPTRWLELDLEVGYTYANIYGTTNDEHSLFYDSEIGLRQVYVLPGARFFLSDSTAVELFAKLPPYSAVADDTGTTNVPFSHALVLEGGLRSRLSRGFFASFRLHYGAIAEDLYGSRFYPFFDVEFRP